MTKWERIETLKHADEEALASTLDARINLNSDQKRQIDQRAVEIVREARQQAARKGLMETFLEEFGLSNNEGLALMCLAESLLRVPDGATADKLIAEKIKSGEWASHKGQSDSWLVNASTLGLMLTGRVVDLDVDAKTDISGFMQKLTRKAGSPVIRAAMMQAMRIMGEQFVVGRSIDEALQRAEGLGIRQKAGLCSFDMLGEGARTRSDAERYFKAYADGIQALGAYRGGPKKEKGDPKTVHGISVKLSALYERYDAFHESQVLSTLYPRLLALCEAAMLANINLCVDAEEADRLVISLKLFKKLLSEPTLKSWTGLGLAVQAYQKRSLAVIDVLTEMARKQQRTIMIRLVKGAYWDSEIKHSQVEGHKDFPVWTRKSTTDLSYLACAKSLFEAQDVIYPQFATHNAHTVAAIQAMAPDSAEYEFQRLHGMGDALFRAVKDRKRVRIYAPVGAHEDLLPYLVRRLLENGANTSFVHSFLDEDVAPEAVAVSPFSDVQPSRHPDIPRPSELFGTRRVNSIGFDLNVASNADVWEGLFQSFHPVHGGPIVDGKARTGTKHAHTVFSPYDAQSVGTIVDASDDDIKTAYQVAQNEHSVWNELGGRARSEVLKSCADRLESRMSEFAILMTREAGKSFHDGIAEVREAIDFLRYYAVQAETNFDKPIRLPGPAGETNELLLEGRGVFCCISPWNFPLAIFIGQIAAALAAGNTVLAKPAEQTPLTAFKMVELCLEAGLPSGVLHLLPGDGESVGAKLVALQDLAGVCFTGSTQVARLINRSLAAKDGAIPVLIAETGGLNGMFVDTTALREQVIDDVVTSAFNAAGQRCSALHILFLPEETADHVIEGIEGAMDSLIIGNPGSVATDVGPVIDGEAMIALTHYLDHLPASMKLRKQCVLPGTCDDGYFVPPSLIELSSLADFNSEQFGPILHVMRYRERHLDNIMADFAAKGFGLTLGIHSRLQSFADRVMAAVPAGNVYINRNIIGAVVAVQPFGGRGLSGTGPKAGGPHYVTQFATERTITNNITAQGGDPALLNLSL